MDTHRCDITDGLDDFVAMPPPRRRGQRRLHFHYGCLAFRLADVARIVGNQLLGGQRSRAKWVTDRPSQPAGGRRRV